MPKANFSEKIKYIILYFILFFCSISAIIYTTHCAINILNLKINQEFSILQILVAGIAIVGGYVVYHQFEKKTDDIEKSKNPKEKDSYLLICVILGFLAIFTFVKLAVTTYKLNDTNAVKYDLFIDLLLIIVTALGIVGIAIYKWIYKKIDDYVKRETKELKKQAEERFLKNRHFTEAHTLKNAGYLHYHIYKEHYSECKNSDERERASEELGGAIEYTDSALNLTRELNEKENKILICIIMNNLICYIAAKQKCIKKREDNKFKEYLKYKENKYLIDKEKVYEFVDYIKERIKERKEDLSLEFRVAFEDTLVKVKEIFPEIDKVLVEIKKEKEKEIKNNKKDKI
jgi:hypothetical protein